MLPSRRLLAIVCCVLVAMAAIVGLVVVHRYALMMRSGQRVEEYARWAVGANSGVTSALTAVTSPPFLLVFAGAVLAWTAWSVRVRGWQVLIASLTCIVGANVTTQTLKLTVVRPDWGFGPQNTWPSGHVTAVMSLAIAAVWATPRRWRPLMVVPVVAMVTCVAQATVLLRWHRVSDAVGAVLVCVAWAALCAAAFRFRPIVHRRLAHAHRVAFKGGARSPDGTPDVAVPSHLGQVSVRTLTGVTLIGLVCVAVAAATTALLFAAGVRGIPGRAAHELGMYALWACSLTVGAGCGVAAMLLPVGQLLTPRWGRPVRARAVVEETAPTSSEPTLTPAASGSTLTPTEAADEETTPAVVALAEPVGSPPRVVGSSAAQTEGQNPRAGQ